VTLLVVVAPRFDRNDLGPLESWTGGGDGPGLADATNYVRYVEVLRGDADELPPAPFRYRPLTPVLAAPLPFEPLTSINVVNVAALALATVGISWTLATLGVGERRRTIGALLFIVSFPTFYYGTIGYVDPLAVALVILATGAILADRPGLLLALLPVAALARESTVIVIAVAVLWLFVRDRDRRWAWTLGWVGSFVGVVAAVRIGLSGPGTNVWEPSWSLALDNLSRPRTWLSAALTLGAPAVVIVVRWRSIVGVRRDVALLLGLGMLASLGVFAYSVSAAYSDGRFLWPIVAFTIPAAMLLLDAPGRPDGDGPAQGDTPEQGGARSLS